MNLLQKKKKNPIKRSKFSKENKGNKNNLLEEKPLNIYNKNINI